MKKDKVNHCQIKPVVIDFDDEFDQDSWDDRWDAAEEEHLTGHPCSQNYIGDSIDFRNGMTAYRDAHGLPDDEFDNEEHKPAGDIKLIRKNRQLYPLSA